MNFNEASNWCKKQTNIDVGADTSVKAEPEWTCKGGTRLGGITRG